jgi:hypothetical protein
MAVVRRTQVGETRTDYRSEGVRPAVARRARRVGAWRGADPGASWGTGTSAGARLRGAGDPGGIGRREARGARTPRASRRAGATRGARRARRRSATAPCLHNVAEHHFEMISLQNFE